MLELSAALPEVTCPRAEVLIREGEVHGRLFVLVDGELEVTRAGTRITVVDHPGAIFGEMSALLGSAATVTVRALRDSRLRRSDDPQGFLDAHPLVARAVATTLARRSTRSTATSSTYAATTATTTTSGWSTRSWSRCTTTRSARASPDRTGSTTRRTGRPPWDTA
jgi:CRP-like cAMP-binding protein